MANAAIVDDHEWRIAARNCETMGRKIGPIAGRHLHNRARNVERELVSQVKAATPYGRGQGGKHLRDTTTAEVHSDGRNAIVIVVRQSKTVGKKGALLARILTEGRPGGQIIRPKRKGGVLAWPEGNPTHFARSVKVGAMKPNDYLARAMQATEPARSEQLRAAGRDAFTDLLADLRKGL